MTIRELRVLARNATAQAFILDMNRRGADPGGQLVFEYMSAIRTNKMRWKKMTLCVIDGKRCSGRSACLVFRRCDRYKRGAL